MCFKLVLFTVIYLEIHTWQYYSLGISAYQYYILGKNGDFKYGFPTENGVAARQEGDNTNQVSGHYLLRDYLGNFGTKYSPGIQGYVPGKEGRNDRVYLEHPYAQGVEDRQNLPTYQSLNNPGQSPSVSRRRPLIDQNPISGQLDYPFDGSTGSSFPTNRPLPTNYFVPQYGVVNPLTPGLIYFNRPPDSRDGASYSFSFDTKNYKRHESSDPYGNVMGYFQYLNDAGIHDLSYTANDKVGFKITGGNLGTVAPVYLPRPLNQENPIQSFYEGSVEPVSSGSATSDNMGFKSGENEPTIFDGYSSSTNTSVTISSKENAEETENNDDTEVSFIVGVTTEK